MITKHFKKLLFKMALVILPIMSAQGVTITYDLNGGELSNGANSYQADSNNNNNAVLDNPTKTGYIFTGWCDTNDYTAATNTCSNRVGLVTTNDNNTSKTMVRWTVPNDLSTDTTFIAMWEEDKFQVITTDLVVDDAIFGFYMTAAGKFWVDWGDGNVEYIDRTNNTNYTNYLHAYSVGNDGGFYTVRFTGLTTGYRQEVAPTDWSIIPSPISFYNNTKVAGIGGSLGRLFPTIGATTQNDPTTGLNPESDYAVLNAIQPRFYKIFSGCTNLTGEIPEDLFVGVEGMPAEYMFNAIFKGCSSLTGSIPEKLFGRVVNNEYHGVKGAPSHRMFEEAFSGCTGLTGSIPENLFKGIIGAPSQAMFRNTFSGCSGLTGSIPENLFSGISGSPTYAMFEGTFRGCFRLTGSIPENLFGRTIKDANNNDVYYGIDGFPTSSEFSYTFSGCSSLTGSIPEKLFGRIVNNEYHGVKGAPSVAMFSGTFAGCSGLTGSIPSGLFGGLYGSPARIMFEATFSGCSGLTGSIPATLFSGISGTPADWMFSHTFSGCSGLTGSIPATLFSGISGTPEEAMFASTFYGCSGLTSYIPPTLFSGINTNTTATNQMSAVFSGTGLLTSCPSGMSQYITGFESDFSGRVSCMQSDRVLCSAGQTLVGTACTTCPDPNDCPTAPTQYTCPNGLFANPTHTECITGYTITYYGLEGTNFANDNPNPNAYIVQTPTFTLNNPTKAGYEFAGWCENEDDCAKPSMTTTITTGSTGDKVFYAQWAAVEEYTISYELNGGTDVPGYPVKYYYSNNYVYYQWRDGMWVKGNGGVPIGNNLVKSGYSFAGWCEGVDNCPNPEDNFTIPYGTTGNKTLYAQWKFQCPAAGMPNESGVQTVSPAWFDLNRNETEEVSECIQMMYRMDGQVCFGKLLCAYAPTTAANMGISCEYLASATCDYATDNISYTTCRYNPETYVAQDFQLYTDCSSVVTVCNETDAVNMLSAMMSGGRDSASTFPVELVKKGHNPDGSDININNWDDYFDQNLMDLVARVYAGMTYVDAWNSVEKYPAMCCADGYYYKVENNAGSCAECPAGSYCVGASYPANTNTSTGAIECPAGSLGSTAGSLACDCPTGYHWTKDITNGTYSCVWGGGNYDCPPFDKTISNGAYVSRALNPMNVVYSKTISDPNDENPQDPWWSNFDNTGYSHDKCIQLMMVADNMAVAGACVNDPTNCDWTEANAGIVECKFDSSINDYVCSDVVKACSAAEFAQIMTAAYANNEAFTSLMRTKMNMPSNNANWYKDGSFFKNSLAGQTLLGTDSFNSYNTCSCEESVCCNAGEFLDTSGATPTCSACPAGSLGSTPGSSSCLCDTTNGYEWNTTNLACACPTGYTESNGACVVSSPAFTCESNTWLHVGNEQICTYATKTTDRALAIRVDANHVYYVMLTPASENDYPIHAGSNHKLKIREYNAAGTESTIYNAHDMSVVSE